MSGPHVLRRSFSLFTRVPTARIAQSAARQGHENITIHRVRIRRPFLSRQRLVGALAVTAATYGLGQYLGLEVKIEEETEARDQKPGRWKKQVRNDDGSLGQVDDKGANNADAAADDEDEDDDDAILFLPTGFSRMKPRAFYKGSDPEWQEFKKLTQNPQRVAKIRQDLVNHVRASFSRPMFAAKIGTVDHSKGKVWIEFKFPDGPPREYERPGYELTSDLEWRKATRPVEVVHHDRLAKLLYPAPAAGALYQDTKRKLERSWSDVAAYMGWAEKTNPPALQQMAPQLSNPPPTSPATTPVATQQPTPPTSDAAKDLPFALPSPQSLTLDLTAFRQDILRSNPHAGHAHHVPRGTFCVHALVEVYTDKARFTLNVHATYDPKAGRYIQAHTSVWNSNPLRQAPKGGP